LKTSQKLCQIVLIDNGQNSIRIRRFLSYKCVFLARKKKYRAQGEMKKQRMNFHNEPHGGTEFAAATEEENLTTNHTNFTNLYFGGLYATYSVGLEMVH